MFKLFSDILGIPIEPAKCGAETQDLVLHPCGRNMLACATLLVRRVTTYILLKWKRKISSNFQFMDKRSHSTSDLVMLQETVPSTFAPRGDEL